MKETVALTRQDEVRLLTIDRVDRGDLTAREAAEQVGLSERQVRRVLAAYRRDGAAAIPHRNRGRPAAHALSPAVKEQVAELARTTYAGTSDRHLRDVLAEREGMDLSRSSVRRIRRSVGAPSPRQRRSPQHRQRRERRPQEGMLLPIDGSPHAWLEERGPRLTLLAAIDDATNQIAGALFAEQEDGRGYLSLLVQIVTTHGRPEAVDHDRSGIFIHHDHETATPRPAGPASLPATSAASAIEAARIVPVALRALHRCAANARVSGQRPVPRSVVFRDGANELVRTYSSITSPSFSTVRVISASKPSAAVSTCIS